MMKLKSEREGRRLSQEALARDLGVSVWTIAKVEQTKYVPLQGSPLGNKLEKFFGRKLKTLLAPV
jgi:ribosome-binding protein aMBF1 (putative translation factor)